MCLCLLSLQHHFQIESCWLSHVLFRGRGTEVENLGVKSSKQVDCVWLVGFEGFGGWGGWGVYLFWFIFFSDSQSILLSFCMTSIPLFMPVFVASLFTLEGRKRKGRV